MREQEPRAVCVRVQVLDAYQDTAGRWWYDWDAKLYRLLDKIDADYLAYQNRPRHTPRTPGARPPGPYG